MSSQEKAKAPESLTDPASLLSICVDCTLCHSILPVKLNANTSSFWMGGYFHILCSA